MIWVAFINKNKMKKKNQIRKYTVDKVEELTETEEIPEMLKLYAEHVADKKTKLLARKEGLLSQLAAVRKRTEKAAVQMVDSVKDRLQRKQRVVMTADSRPTNDDIKNMTDLFTYMQNQGELICKNSDQLVKLEQFVDRKCSQVPSPTCDYSELDNSFAHLQSVCAIEQKEAGRLQDERDRNREFYKNIKQTIQECRVKYEKVQSLIAEREKELDHLVSYFQTRQREDLEKVERENGITTALENELLKAQEILNFNSEKSGSLRMAQIQLGQ